LKTLLELKEIDLNLIEDSDLEEELKLEVLQLPEDEIKDYILHIIDNYDIYGECDKKIAFLRDKRFIKFNQKILQEINIVEGLKTSQSKHNIKISISVKEEYLEEFIKNNKFEIEIEKEIAPEILLQRAKKQILEKYFNVEVIDVN